MGFQRRRSDNKSLQVSRTLLSILVDPNYVLVWMFSIVPLISNCSRLQFYFPSFGKVQVFFYLSPFLKFSLSDPLELQNPPDDKFSFFLLIISRSGFLVGIE